jgi:hypothetical protein
MATGRLLSFQIRYRDRIVRPPAPSSPNTRYGYQGGLSSLYFGFGGV